MKLLLIVLLLCRGKFEDDVVSRRRLIDTKLF